MIFRTTQRLAICTVVACSFGGGAAARAELAYVSFSDFVPSATYGDWVYDLPGGHVRSQFGDTNCFVASLNGLPDGATVDAYVVHYYDNDEANDLSITVWRKDIVAYWDPSAEALLTLETAGTYGYLTAGGGDVDEFVVDHFLHEYYVTACMTGDVDLRMYAFGLEYTPGPLVRLDVASWDAEVVVTNDSWTTKRRKLFQLENNGPPEFVLKDTDRDLTWKFGTRQDTFEINRGGSGQTELILRANGDLDIKGTLSQGSSRTLKENFAPIDTSDLLDRVLTLPLSTWNYTDRAEDDRHLGPTAEDFHAAFGLGDNPERLAPADAAGVALAAIQALWAELEEVRATCR